MTTSPHAWDGRLDGFRRDLEQIFGRRLRSVVAYDTHFGLESALGGPADETPHLHAMVLVESVSFGDLLACAARTAAWHKGHVAAPLLLTEDEFARSLDAFPLEFAGIAWHHQLVAGTDPFDRWSISDADLRRACETQARSHLLHLREGFLETRGDPALAGRLIAQSVPSLRSILASLARLDGVPAKTREALAHHAAARLDVPVELVDQLLGMRGEQALASTDAHRIYTAYLDAVERLVTFIDGWKAA